ncbi:D-amino-acid transaminase [Maricaulis salignorans]|uniref:Probable branched-chain-amino-acid aminotransferase n=1 Tax=Maricaulis salignorans TaxID=144026 RepID=A0A1G9NZV8_9PROT|nr:D-amino-acid transaminase [Maricaulis salignorans]SDL91939.1 D-alanine aminotransferase apoenzyme [Maricaulis salignorans]
MTRFAYVNGRYLPQDEALIHIEDRGFQFADAIYEVWSVRSGELLDADGHFGRLERSLAELRITNPKSRAGYRLVIAELLRRNRVRDGLVYLQVSRGRARRDHAFPAAQTRPTVVMTAKRLDPAAADRRADHGVAVITRPDQRWARCDIKTVNLLPNVLAKQAAIEAGAAEAWLVDEAGKVTEGSSTNAWILNAEGVLVTRQADHAILHGITRSTIMNRAAALGYRVEERAFSVEEAQTAREAFMTSATTFVTAITSIDGRPVGNGAPGSVAIALREAYLESL